MLRRGLIGLALLLPLCLARAQEVPHRLKVLGFYTHTGLFADFEEPFWIREVPALTGGRLLPSTTPLDRAGIRESELLSFLRLGVVQGATVPLALAAGDDPELSVVDLPGLNADLPALRRSLAQWRPHLTAVLEERYDIHLLGLLVPTTQVVFCREAFARLGDVAGRRVRVGSVSQGELIEALGGIALAMPLNAVPAAMRSRTLDCAVTGPMPGNRIGLGEVATHVSRLPLSWFVSALVVNGAAWRSLPEAERQALHSGGARLEQRVIDGAEAAIEDGFACNAGLPRCAGGQRARMTVLDERWDEAERRRLLRDVLLPRWVARCGADCAQVWNQVAAASLGLWLEP
ncbi:TRAP transporter substrate-binding protein DctP [Belnapia sp. F-4-1]|uniref:TRAP transporter substrate-binding protein DctP n=1 Tax=Belnapia sp. F-4-1 TaxID=1545443 RepID=UPI00068EE728|nr:TRAP transporter substrate-binding protein DctP [Belnapia sp. F-4-1]